MAPRTVNSFVIDRLSSISLSKKTCSIELPADAVQRTLEAAAQARIPTVVLSTCERFEVYALGADVQHIALHTPAPGADLYTGHNALMHLFRVAAGLTSSLPGEPHILGQVKRAAELAALNSTLSPDLRTLFDRAIRAGKRARTQTTLGKVCTSYAALAAQEVAHAQHVAVLGTGSLARDVITAVQKQRRANITVVSRHMNRAQDIAAATGASCAHIDDLHTVITNADALIAATASPRTLVRQEHVTHTNRPITLVDLGMPANIDAALGTQPGVTLRTLADLPNAASVVPQQAIEHAQRVVESEVSTFLHRENQRLLHRRSARAHTARQ